MFQAAGFAPEELVVIPDDRVLERSVDDVVAWVLSTSSTAPHLFGDHLDDFIHDLRRLLLDVSPEGRFSVALSDNRLRIRRPRADTAPLVTGAGGDGAELMTHLLKFELTSHSFTASLLARWSRC